MLSKTLKKNLLLSLSLVALFILQFLTCWSFTKVISDLAFDSVSYTSRTITDELKEEGVKTGIIKTVSDSQIPPWKAVDIPWGNTDNSSKNYYEAYEIALATEHSSPFLFTSQDDRTVSLNAVAPLSYINETIYSSMMTTDGNPLEPFQSPDEIYLSEEAATLIDYSVSQTNQITLKTSAGEERVFTVKGVISNQNSSPLGFKNFVFYQYMNNWRSINDVNLHIYIDSSQENWFYFCLKMYGKEALSYGMSVELWHLDNGKMIKNEELSSLIMTVDSDFRSSAVYADILTSSLLTVFFSVPLYFLCDYTGRLLLMTRSKKVVLGIESSLLLIATTLFFCLIKFCIPFSTLAFSSYMASFKTLSVSSVFAVFVCFFLPSYLYRAKRPNPSLCRRNSRFRRIKL